MDKTDVRPADLMSYEQKRDEEREKCKRRSRRKHTDKKDTLSQKTLDI